MLSNRHKQILSFIQDYIDKNGCSPFLSEIVTRIGLKSQASVHMCLMDLENEGFIDRTGSRSRKMRVLKTA
jgi:repressor LexA